MGRKQTSHIVLQMCMSGGSELQRRVSDISAEHFSTKPCSSTHLVSYNTPPRLSCSPEVADSVDLQSEKEETR